METIYWEVGFKFRVLLLWDMLDVLALFRIRYWHSGRLVDYKLNEVEKMVYGVDDLKEPLTPLTSAYARAHGSYSDSERIFVFHVESCIIGSDCMSSFGDFIALPAPCDIATARI